MKKRLLIVLSFALFYLVSFIYQGCGNSPSIQNRNESLVKSECPQATKPFPSYDDKHYGPPPWWCKENKINEMDFPIFQINTDYPRDYEAYIDSKFCSEKVCTWKQFNFKVKADRDNYLKEVIKYAFEGNLEANWVVQKNTKGRKWFHAPYMHLNIVDPINSKIINEKVAREFIHGLTMERTGCLDELNYKIVSDESCPSQNNTHNFQSWAVSFYNERGASYIGKVWDEMINPKSITPDPQNFPLKGFPDGTVAIKLLFTQAPPNKVPYLENSVEWEGDTADFIRDGGYQNTKRVKESGVTEEDCKKDWNKCFTKLRLLQIDVAVRDEREKEEEKSPTGWVFATFTYDKNADPFINYGTEEEDRKNPWLRIKPLGLMFGNDPDVQKGEEIKETLLNSNLEIPQHYGCGSDQNPFLRRLNGPVDNPASSCLSCHAQSETPQNLDINGVRFSDMKCQNQSNIVEWFKNVNPRDLSSPTFTVPTKDNPLFSLDYSLQLREGIRRYCTESYSKGTNKCNLSFKKGDQYTVVTKQGIETFTVQ